MWWCKMKGGACSVPGVGSKSLALCLCIAVHNVEMTYVSAWHVTEACFDLCAFA